jgi:hypothetical protein
LVVRTEEELRQRLEEGWRLYRDELGFTLYNPLTKKKERVDKSLYHLCEYLYSKYGKAKQEKSGVAQVSAGEVVAEEGGAGEDEVEQRHTTARSLSRVLEEDVKLIVSMIKQKLDPKAPILSKWIENISFWHHVIYSTSAHLLADLLSMLGEGEIDLSNPEVMVKNMVAKFRLLKVRALKAEEVEAKYRAELEALKQRVADLESLLGKYAEVIREQNKLIEDLAGKTKRTIAFFVVEVPNYLPEDARAPYRVLAAKVREIWGGGGE